MIAAEFGVVDSLHEAPATIKKTVTADKLKKLPPKS